MELPAPPSPVHLPSTSTTTSPVVSRPPSPISASRSSSAAPSTFQQQTGEAQDSAYSTRNSSRSKDPLFKREGRAARGGESGSAWIEKVKGLLSAGPGPGQAVHERGRRPSVAQVERGIRPTASSLAGEPKKRWQERGSRPTTSSLVGEPKKRWQVSEEKLQLAVCFGMIGIVGLNDSATGANLASMQEYYKVTYDYISLVFLSNVAGYFFSCLSSSFLTHHLGLRYTLHLAALSLCSGCLLLSFAPPFGAFIAAVAMMGFGGGLYDAAITTVISHEEDGALMSYTYAFFGVGATFSPLIIGSFVDKGYPWNRYYYCPLGISVILALVSHYAFRNFQPPSDEHSHPHELELSTIPSHTAAPSSLHAVPSRTTHGQRATMSVQTRMIRALKMPFVWVGFLLIILAFGMTDVLSGWMVSFQNEKRGMPDAAARYNLSGLWAGIALGRVVLAYFLDERLGERSFSIIMLTCTAGLLGIVWAVRNYIVDAVALVLVGFFLGPVTPKVLSTVSARVPPSLKGSTMSMTIGLGLIGSAVGPLLFGVAAGKGYLASLPAVLIVCSVIAGGIWSVVPKNQRRED